MDDIIGKLASQFGLQPTQAEGAAGSLFKLAQQHAGQADFQQLLGALPQIQQWMGKAPAATDAGAGGGGLLGQLGGLAGSLGGGGGASALSALAALQQSGLKPETIAQFVPTLLSLLRQHVDPALVSKVMDSVPALKALAGGEGSAGLAGSLGKLLAGR